MLGSGPEMCTTVFPGAPTGLGLWLPLSSAPVEQGEGLLTAFPQLESTGRQLGRKVLWEKWYMDLSTSIMEQGIKELAGAERRQEMTSTKQHPRQEAT